MGEFANMINRHEIDVKQYFTMHPFSATENILYRAALDDVDFFSTFYITSNKTYERLATVCSIVENAAKNMIVVTGYRGCGKTNFLRLIEYIFDSGRNIEKINEAWNRTISKANGNTEIEQTIRSAYSRSTEIIKSRLYSRFHNTTAEDVCESFCEYIFEQFTGFCKYINFDSGGVEEEKPLQKKLFFLMRESFERDFKANNAFEILNLVSSFINRNKWHIMSCFASTDYQSLMKFIDEEVKQYHLCNTTDEFYMWLQSAMNSLTLELLLFVYTTWEYASIIQNNNLSNGKLIYLLDNIDIISNDTSDIFTNTMSGIWNFIWDTRQAFDIIAQQNNPDDIPFVSLYNKTKFIVAMRETTAMRISGHLRDKMRSMIEHFDMSADVDKVDIIQRRIDFAQDLIHNKNIINPAFIEYISCINKLVQDRYLMLNLFKMYNNDYRTSVMSLLTICIEHIEDVKRALYLIQDTNKFSVFGGRGIIYKLIFEAFFNWDYFEAIGISCLKHRRPLKDLQSNYSYSCSRIILTILCNRQAKIPERFFVNEEESVRLRELYSIVKDFMDLNDFIRIIEGMYSLRNKRFWNHMVTFDNILYYSPTQIRNHLIRVTENDKDIFIRATSAGQVFVHTLCVHFEYFATRFSSLSKGTPLFSLVNLGDEKVWSCLKRIISDVFEAVRECCINLEEYNIRVLKAIGEQHYSKSIATSYYYESQFHEERLIHNHISYLEAYRQYVIKLPLLQPRKLEVSNLIAETIQKYLDLLKYNKENGIKRNRDEFISENSKYLYNELSVCVEKLLKKKDPCCNIEITRDFYLANYKKEICKFIQNSGITLIYN